MKNAFLTGMFIVLVGCGGGVDKKGTPDNNSTANNTSTNNGSTNNTSTNNGSTNNTPTNNTTNNTMNGTPCVDIAPTALNFGVVEEGSSKQASVTLENCSNDASLQIDSVSSSNAAFQIATPAVSRLDTLQSISIPVTFTPNQPGGVVGEVTVGTSAGEVTVAVQGEAPSDANCPTPVAQGRATSADPWTDGVESEEGNTVFLTSASSSPPNGQTIVAREWTFVTKPAGSTSQLQPSSASESPTLFLDEPGTYTLDLRVSTDNSPADCPADRVVVQALPVDGGQIRVELVWETIGDNDLTDNFGGDLDLHYAHPLGQWDDAPYDCFWNNKVADWGTDGLAEMIQDDVDGEGPEQITHSDPGPKIYEAGVYYFADNGFGKSDATVRVRYDGTLVFESQKVTLNQTGDFWYGIMIDWPNQTVTNNAQMTTNFPPR